MIKQYDEDIVIPKLDNNIKPETLEDEEKVELKEELIMQYTGDNKIKFIAKEVINGKTESI